MSNQQLLWSQCLKELRRVVPSRQFDAWISPLSLLPDGVAKQFSGPVASDPMMLRLQAPNRYVQERVSSKYLPLINQAVIREIKKGDVPYGKVEIALVLVNGSDSSDDEAAHSDQVAFAVKEDAMGAAEPLLATVAPETAGKPIVLNAGENHAYSSALDERFTLEPAFNFDNFVVGEANQRAHALAWQLAEDFGKQSGQSPNPLSIYGATALGKTHLMNAVGNALLSKSPATRIAVVNAQDFLELMVDGFKNHRIDNFKHYFRSLDALFIDDINMFPKEAVRAYEQLYYFLSHFIRSNRQVIITCDRNPRDLSHLPARLRSRLDCGSLVQILPPEESLRANILRKKAADAGIQLREDVVSYLARHINSNVRALDGALKTLISTARFHNRPQNIDCEMARDLLEDTMTGAKRVTLADIVRVIAKFYGVNQNELLSKTRVRAIVQHRQMAMFIAREKTNHSLPEIGKFFEGRNHATVCHACKKVSQKIDTERHTASEHQKILDLLNEG